MAKAVLSCLLPLMLCACASDYNPYVEEISSNGQVVQSAGSYYGSSDYAYVTVSPFYPWGSIDYFYFGNHYYQSAYSPAYVVGVSYWSPWYSPYYGPFYNPYYYSAWYPGFYPYSYAYFGYGYGWGWYGRGYPYGRYYGNRYHGRYGYEHQRGQSAGVPVTNHGGTRRQGQYGNTLDQRSLERETMTRERGWRSPDQAFETQRNVSVSSSPDGSDRGMIIRSRSDRKVGQNRPQPVTVPANPVEASVNTRVSTRTQPRFDAPASAPPSSPRSAPAVAPRPSPRPPPRPSYSRSGDGDFSGRRPDRDKP